MKINFNLLDCYRRKRPKIKCLVPAHDRELKLDNCVLVLVYFSFFLFTIHLFF